MGPTFLTLAEVRRVHRDQVNRYGGSDGVRDVGLLESALAQPGAMFGGAYLHAGLAEMAAAYLYHLVQNHPFVDGNKRVGAVAALVFLRLNGADVTASNDELEAIVMAVARGKADKGAVTAFFTKHVV